MNTLRICVLAALATLTGCAGATTPTVTVDRMPQVHRPQWLTTVPDRLLALDECLEELEEPAFVLHIQQLESRTGVATLDGRGKMSLCVWSEDKGIELRQPSTVSLQDVSAHPVLHVGSKEPSAPSWAVVEPIRVDEEVVAWAMWRNVP